MPEDSHLLKLKETGRQSADLRRKNKKWLILLLLAAGIAAVVGLRMRNAAETTRTAQEGNKAPRFIPVVAAPVAQRVVPIFL